MTGSETLEKPTARAKIYQINPRRDNSKSNIIKIYRTLFNTLFDKMCHFSVLDIQHFMYDARVPKQFLVYPPALDTAQLEVVYTEPALAHALAEADLNPANNNTTVISLDDTYAAPIVDWVLYRAFSKDAEHGNNVTRAAAHYAAFTNALGAKNETDSAADPKVPVEVA